MMRRWFEGLKLVRVVRELRTEWRSLKEAEHNAAVEAKKIHVQMAIMNEVRRKKLEELKLARANAHKLIAQAAAYKAKNNRTSKVSTVANPASTTAPTKAPASAIAPTTTTTPVKEEEETVRKFKHDMLGRLEGLLPDTGLSNTLIRSAVHDTVKDSNVEGKNRAQMAASMVASVAVSTEMSDKDTMELIDSLVFDDHKVRDQVKANVQQAIDNARARKSTDSH